VNPTTPAWFTASIDRRTYQTLRLRMTAAAHFMQHRYVEFDRPLAIRPPR
jgi:non-ribosomal peptide synthetase component F